MDDDGGGYETVVVESRPDTFYLLHGDLLNFDHADSDK